MFNLLFARLWPVFLPFIVYLIWRAGQKRKTTYIADGEMKEAEVLGEQPRVHWLKTPLFWTVLSSAAIFILLLFYIGVTDSNTTEGTYVPPQMENGRLIPGHME